MADNSRQMHEQQHRQQQPPSSGERKNRDQYSNHRSSNDDGSYSEVRERDREGYRDRDRDREGDYPDAPHLGATNDSLSYSNSYSTYPPKPNYYPPNYPPNPNPNPNPNPPYNGRPPYGDPSRGYGDGYLPPQHRGGGGGYSRQPPPPAYQAYPSDPYYNNGGDSQDDLNDSYVTDRSYNSNYPPNEYYRNPNHNHNPNYYQHQQPQHLRQPPQPNQRMQPQPAPHRQGQVYQSAELEDTNDLSFVSESRLLPANPWSSSDMLSNLIPLGSNADNKRRLAAKPSRSEMEQSLASNSLLLYLGNRTPPTESMADRRTQNLSANLNQVMI